MSDDPPDVDYLCVSLDLTESGNGEMRKLALSPCFDKPRMEFSIVEGGEEEDETVLILNRRQIECLADFLAAWLEHVK
jgi:hypothetical protein